MASFLKDRLYVEEGHKVDDLLDFSREVGRLDSSLKEVNYSSIIGYVGKFGSGKSTTIHQLERKYSDNSEARWFEFDAWKYPERKDLWEGFVLDIANQIGLKNKTVKKITGSSNKFVGAANVIATALSHGAWAPFAGQFSSLFKGKPIERVFELQDLLCKLLNGVSQQNIYIVIEDIDRSGDAGQYFLETLRQFIRNNLSTKKIIVLVPIGSEVYDENKQHQASYQKTLDYTLYFEPRGIKYSNYIECIFDESSFLNSFQTGPNVISSSRWKLHLEDWFNLSSTNGLTIREIKSVIRSADLAYSNLMENGFQPDPRIVLAFQLLNSIKTEGGARWITRISIENPISDNCPISKYLQLIATNTTLGTLSKNYTSIKLNLVDRADEPIPRILNNVFHDENSYVLSDYYLIPFGQKWLKD